MENGKADKGSASPETKEGDKEKSESKEELDIKKKDGLLNQT